MNALPPVRVRAPAKINLYLRVLGRRPDGYHALETLFERIDLADTLTVEPDPRMLRLTCTDPALSCGDDNLVMKAARLLQQRTRLTAGARLHLEKRIPIAAGLGGGSSDAAAALYALNRLWGLSLDRGHLLELASELGSDVPFFLTETPFAVGTGRGEVCEPIPTNRRLSHVLVIPDERLSTKEVYEGSRFDLSTGVQNRIPSAAEGFDLTREKPSISMMRHALSNGSLSELALGLWNDLEPEAIRRCPAIVTIQSRLRALGCLGVRLSGSGPSVFGLCHDDAQARNVAQRLRRDTPSAWRIELARTDRSLLCDDIRTF